MTTTTATYLTPAEVGTALGLSKTTAHVLIKAGRFPGAWKDGAIVRVPAEDVQAYVAAHRIARAS